VNEPPDSYVEWAHPSPLLTAIGGFLCHPDDPRRIGFTVDSRKVNGRGFLHTGVIAAIADVAIGHALADTSNPPTPLVTVNLVCNLLSSASLGDWVTGFITPTRSGRRIAAGTATLSTDRVIATVTALFVPAGNQL
jgi:acyl-coenzyme A thioesterase PaaI-like protein